MDFTIPASDLVRAVTRAKGIALTRAPTVITNNLHVSVGEKQACFTAFDGTLAVSTTLPVAMTEPGAVLMPFDVSPFLLTLTGSVRLATNRGAGYPQLLVSMHQEAPAELARKGGREKAKKASATATELRVGLPHRPEAFVKLPTEEAELVPVPAATLRELLGRVVHAASQDETRPTLCAVYLHSAGKGLVRAAATDGHRLIYVEREVQGLELKQPVLLPLAAAKKLIEVLAEDVSEGWHMGLAPGIFILEKGEVRVLTRTVDGLFPEYERLVPKLTRPALVPRLALLDMVRRIGILGEESVLRLTLKPQQAGRPAQLFVTASNQKVGEGKDELDVSYSGPEGGGLFHLKHLTEALKAMGEVDEVAMQLPAAEEHQPLLMRPAGDGSTAAIVMPRRG